MTIVLCVLNKIKNQKNNSKSLRIMKAAHEVNNSRLWWMLLTFKVLSSNPNLIHLVVSVKRECWQKLENLEADDDSSHQ